MPSLESNPLTQLWEGYGLFDFLQNMRGHIAAELRASFGPRGRPEVIANRQSSAALGGQTNNKQTGASVRYLL
jgi:hypothetical protein